MNSFFAPAVMTSETLRRICKDTGGYSQPHLNDHLLLQCKGFTVITNLDDYVGLRCLWLQENAISKIEGLDNLRDIRTLYLHQNCISKIENLHPCSLLNTVNLSNNWISYIENLSCLHHLETLIISHCRLSSMNSIRHIWEIPSLQVIDLSNNKIDIEGDEQPEDFIGFWKRMPNLAVLYVHGNEIVNRIRHYRKKMVSQLDQLTYLDERPIFGEERRIAKAWAVGGHEAESSERSLIAEEKAAELKRDIERWKEIQNKGKDAKVVREKEWQEQLEQKKIEDEVIRLKRHEQQDELIQDELRARDGVEVEAYRSETALLQVVSRLKNLGMLQTRERADLAVVEGAQRRQVQAMEVEDYGTISNALESLLAGRKPEPGKNFLVSLSRDRELASWIEEMRPTTTTTAAAPKSPSRGGVAAATAVTKPPPTATENTGQQQHRPIISAMYILEAHRKVAIAWGAPAEDEEKEEEEQEGEDGQESWSSPEKVTPPPPPAVATTTPTAAPITAKKNTKKTEDIWKMYLTWERKSINLL